MDEQWPSVTEILRFFQCYRRYKGDGTQYMLRGRRVDTAMEYLARGAAIEDAHAASHLRERASRRFDDSLSDEERKSMLEEADFIAAGHSDTAWEQANAGCVCMGYLLAADKFLREHCFSLLHAQFEIRNQHLRYRGHPDWLIRSTSGYELLSIKSGDLPNWCGTQESFYLLGDPVGFEWPAERYAIKRSVVQVRSDGSYTFTPLTGWHDFEIAEVWAKAFWHSRAINGPDFDD